MKKVLNQKISDRELWKLIRKHKDAAKEILQVSDIVLYVKDKNGKRIEVKWQNKQKLKPVTFAVNP